LNPIEFWTSLANKLQSAKPLFLHVVVEHRGSSPGKTGAKMWQCADGSSAGSIGGGIMEFNLITKTAALFGESNPAAFRTSLTHTSKSQNDKIPSGLICSGSQVIYSLPLQTDLLPSLNRALKAVEEHKPQWMAIKDHPSGLWFSEAKPDCKCIYQECLTLQNVVLIFGDGHIGKALEQQMILLGYPYRLIPVGHERLDFDETRSLLPKSKTPYAVIVTSNAQTDLQCLQLLRDVPLAYCGLMGSRPKLDAILTKLIESGPEPTWFGLLRAPIGLPINSHRPAEIAVSIAAQLIATFNSGE